MFTLILFACNSKPAKPIEPDSEEVEVQITGLVEDVLTKEEQDALTPDMVIQSLREGNERFTSNDLTARDYSSSVRESVKAQYSKAIILSCG